MTHENESGFVSHIKEAGKHRMFIFMISILSLLILSAIVEGSRYGHLIINLISSAVLIFGIYAVSKNKKSLVILIILGFPWFFSEWRYLTSSKTIFTGILFFTFVTVTIFNHVLRSKHVTADTRYGSVCVYLLLGVVWASIYGFLEYISPGTVFMSNDLTPSGIITSNGLMYYSFTTLTTLGYGDITLSRH